MKKLATMIIVLVASVALTAQNFNMEWLSHTPNGNTHNKVVVKDANNIMLFGEFGNMLTTNDGGTNWNFEIIDPNKREIEEVCTVDENIAFLCGADGLVMKTVDGGATWNAQTLPTVEDLLDIDFIDADTGYVVGDGGIKLKTVDGGANWVELPGDSLEKDIKALDIVAPDFIVIGSSSSDQRHLSVSTDYGATWQELGPNDLPNKTVTAVEFVSKTHGWFAIQDQGKTYYTTDGGANWTMVQLADIYVIYDMVFTDENNGYICNSSGKFFTTTDGGQTYTMNEVTDDMLYSIGILGSTVWTVGDVGRIFKSTDGAANFTAAYTSIYFDQGARAIHFFNENLGYVGAGDISDFGHLLKTENGGATWTQLPYDFGDRIYRMAFPSEDVMYVGTANSTSIHISKDGGQNWTVGNAVFTSASAEIYGLDYASTDVVYAGNSDGEVAKTTDGGATWNLVTSSCEYIYDLVVLDENTVLTAGKNAICARTKDGGATWDTLNIGIPGNLFAIDFYNSQVGVVTGYDSPNPWVSLTTDGGDTWTPIIFPVGYDVYGSIWGIDFFDANTIFMVLINGDILYTTDQGQTWAAVPSVTTESLYDISIAGNAAFISGNECTVYKLTGDVIPVELTSFAATISDNAVVLKWNTSTETNNSGFEVQKRTNNTGWTKVAFVKGAGTTTEARSYTYVDNNVLNAKTYYRLKQVDYNGSFEYSDVVEVDAIMPSDYALDQNFPNPFNPETTIKYALPQSGKVSLKVYNVVGKEVKTIVNRVQSAGTYSVSFDASELPSGVYFYELKADNYRSVKKMVLMK